MLLLVALLLLLLIIAYYVSGRDMISPPTLFIAGFLACACIALVFSDTWEFKLHAVTFLVITAGCILFLLSTRIMHHLFPVQTKAPTYRYIRYNAIIFLSFIALQLVTIVLTYSEIQRLFPAGSILESVALYDQTRKFTENASVSFAFPVGMLRNICGAYGMVLGFFIAQDVVYRKKRFLPCLILSFCLGILLNMQSGGRSGAIGNIVSLALCFLLIASLRNGRATRVTANTALWIVGICVFLFATFQLSLGLLGRSSERNPLEYISVYVGAQIPNLDSFLLGTGQQEHSVWGYMTFINSIRWLGTKLGIAGWIYQLDLPFRVMNGYGMGNVYTTFYSLVYDFGYIGLSLVMVMGLVSQYVYEKVWQTCRKRWTCIWIPVYAYLGYVLLMSFFSQWFFESFFAIGMLRTIIYMILIASFITLRPTRAKIGKLEYIAKKSLGIANCSCKKRI